MIKPKKTKNQFLSNEKNTNANKTKALERPQGIEDSRKFSWK